MGFEALLSAQVIDTTSVGRSVMTAADAAAARTAIGAIGQAQDLASATIITDDDVFYMVDDPSGTPGQRKVAASVFRQYSSGQFGATLVDGLILSNNATDANNDIDIASGLATVSDGSNWWLATLSSGITKRLDASWAVGTNQGGLDTGTEATSTWYHVWLIQRSDTGVVDVLFSTSATAPTMPTNYDRKRRIGAIYNNASGNIEAFTQIGDEFLWSTCKVNTRVTNPGTSAVLRTIIVPSGIKCNAKVNVAVYGASTTAHVVRLSSPDQTDESVAVGNAQASYATTLGLNRIYQHCGYIRTNTSSQIRTRHSVSSASVDFDLGCEGWIDPRGRNA